MNETHYFLYCLKVKSLIIIRIKMERIDHSKLSPHHFLKAPYSDYKFFQKGNSIIIKYYNGIKLVKKVVNFDDIKTIQAANKEGIWKENCILKFFKIEKKQNLIYIQQIKFIPIFYMKFIRKMCLVKNKQIPL